MTGRPDNDSVQIEAVPIDGIAGVQASDDGQRALIRVRNAEGEGIFAFSFDTLIPLMQTLSAGFAKCRTAQGLGPETKHVLPLEWWHFQAVQNDMILLSFRMPGGMEMSFQVHRNVAPQMKDALTAASGGTVEFPPGIQKQ